MGLVLTFFGIRTKQQLLPGYVCEIPRCYCRARKFIANASVNSKHQHPPGLTPGEFFKVVKFPAPGQKIFAKLRPRGKKIDKNPAPGDNFVDLQDNFAMIAKPFAFFWYSSLAWLSSRFFSKIIKLANTKFLSDSSIAQLRFDMYGKN